MGRFIHEFESNKTAIVDQTAKRCFVMPLDREKVLPPRSMFDMIQKMSDGKLMNILIKIARTVDSLTVPL